MKKSILIFSAVICCNLANAQKESDVEKKLDQVENSKSGNFKDIFSSLFQFALKNVSNEEKAIELNSTLFAVARKHRPDLLAKRSRTTIAFLRNFQVNAKINLTDNYKFNGYAGGFTYAIVNKRDKGFINLIGTPVDLVHKNYTRLTGETTGEIRRIYRSRLNSEKLAEINNVIENKTSVPDDEIYNAYVATLNEKIVASTFFRELESTAQTSLKTGEEVYAYFQGLKSDVITGIEKKPLLTLATIAAGDKGGELKRGSVESIFLVGDKGWEIDARAKFAYDDTLAVSMPRTFINSKLGVNFIVDKDNDKKSSIELKAYAEYNKILRNLLPGEKEDTFFANADLRVRITNDLWIPFTVKYDIENENFLGFLNVTYNFGD